MAARKKKSVASGKTEIIVNAAGAKRRAPARRRSGGGGRSRIRRAVRGYSRASRAKQRGMIAAAAAAMGYASQMPVAAGETTNMYAKVPAFGGLPVEATIALGAHFLAKGKPGLADDVATAAAAIAGYKIGKNGLKLEGLQVADLSGLGDMGGMSGMSGEFDDLGYDDDVGYDGDDVGDDGYID
jgi:hypothetical protein